MRRRIQPCGGTHYWQEKRRENMNGLDDIIEKGGRFIENTVNAFITDVCSLNYASNHYNNVRNIVYDNNNIRERMEIPRRNNFIDDDENSNFLANIHDRIDQQMAMRQHIRNSRQTPDKLFDMGHFDPTPVMQPQVQPPQQMPQAQPQPHQQMPQVQPQQLTASNIVQTRSIIHGDMKNNQIVYINMLGKDISVLVKRKSGNKELEFFKGGDAILNDLVEKQPDVKRRQYVSEFGMKVSMLADKKPNIIDILTNNNSMDAFNGDAKVITFIIPNGVYGKIDWHIPESVLNGKKIWIFSPGDEISGGDAICGHELYDSFISWSSP